MSEKKEKLFKIETSALRAYTMIAALALNLAVFSLGDGFDIFDLAQFVEFNAANFRDGNHRRRNADGHYRRTN
jgi:hypothetical protein